MGKRSESGVWFFPTSPRSPEKLQGELQVLKQFEGRTWNEALQTDFYRALAHNPEYKGGDSKDPAFAGRDRITRGPRILGLVHLPARGKKGVLSFTAAGNALLEVATATDITYLFQRQVAKVQFPSPLHRSAAYIKMAVRPALVVLKLLTEVGWLSESELALFGLTTTTPEAIETSVERIREYRSQTGIVEPGVKRRERKAELRNVFVRSFYGAACEIEKRYATLVDYADASMRYLRATGLVTISKDGNLVLSSVARDDADFLLNTYGIGAVSFAPESYEEYILTYLGNPSVPLLRADDPSVQAARVASILDKAAAEQKSALQPLVTGYRDAQTPQERLRALGTLADAMSTLRRADELRVLKADRRAAMEEVKELYASIATRGSGVVDKPLFYEWNAWRGLHVINDAKAIKGNLRFDWDGMPVSTAGGKQSDSVVEYEAFWLAVEVTLQSGRKQYDSEGEPIIRHVGTLQKDRQQVGDLRPVFGLFIAEKIWDEVVHFLQTEAIRRSRVYGGEVRVLPLTRIQFEDLMSIASETPFNHRLFLGFMERCFDSGILAATDELEWRAHIAAELQALGARARVESEQRIVLTQ